MALFFALVLAFSQPVAGNPQACHGQHCGVLSTATNPQSQASLVAGAVAKNSRPSARLSSMAGTISVPQSVYPDVQRMRGSTESVHVEDYSMPCAGVATLAAAVAAAKDRKRKRDLARLGTSGVRLFLVAALGVHLASMPMVNGVDSECFMLMGGLLLTAPRHSRKTAVCP